MRRFAFAILIIICMLQPGCSREARDRLHKVSTDQANKAAQAEAVAHDPFTADAEAGPNGGKYMQAVKPFYMAVAAGQYDKAYDLLAPHALKNVHPWQFVQPNEENAPQPPRIEQLTKDEFVKGMKQVEAKFGPPKKVTDISMDTERDTLSGKDRISAMYYVGMITDAAPVELRKAAFRGEIRCQFTPESKKEMEPYEKTDEELESDENDLYPRFKLKTVLLEVDGALKIGYFECVPESILD